jgi:hypothetical protein
LESSGLANSGNEVHDFRCLGVRLIEQFCVCVWAVVR